LSDERAALWSLPCWHEEYASEPRVALKSEAQAGHLVRLGPRHGQKTWHGLPVRIRKSDSQTIYAGDDPDEAQAAFERGSEYVRTGVLE
jgi:hypothetical protein